MKTRKKAAFKVYDDMPAASCQFLIIPPQHLWPPGFSSPPKGLPFSHTTRDGIKDPVPRVSDILLAYDVFSVILCVQNVRPSGVFFSKETVCAKFQIAREKSGGDCHHHFLKVVVTCTVTYKVTPMVKATIQQQK